MYVHVYTIHIDIHASMLNLTTRLAIKMDNIPGWNIDWLDNKPQQLRNALNYTHFISNKEDAECLEKYAIQYMMEFLVDSFSSLRQSHLGKLVPSR